MSEETYSAYLDALRGTPDDDVQRGVEWLAKTWRKRGIPNVADVFDAIDASKGVVHRREGEPKYDVLPLPEGWMNLYAARTGLHQPVIPFDKESNSPSTWHLRIACEIWQREYGVDRSQLAFSQGHVPVQVDRPVTWAHGPDKFHEKDRHPKADLPLEVFLGHTQTERGDGPTKLMEPGWNG